MISSEEYRRCVGPSVFRSIQPACVLIVCAFALTAACARAPRAVVQPLRAVVEPLRPGELAGSGWTVMSPAGGRMSGQRIVLDGTLIRSIAVPVVSANPRGGDSLVTMTVVAANGDVLARVGCVIPTASQGWVRFALPGKGLALTPGSVVFLWMANEASEVFGWRYQGNDHSA